MVKPIPKPLVRSAYNYDRKAASDAVSISCPEPTLTQQQFKLDSDPNQIIKAYMRTGNVNLLNAKSPTYGDFSGSEDFQSAMNSVIAAQDSFMSLPANIRSRFGNDPGQLLDFMADANNSDEAVRLGLIPPPPAEDLSPVPAQRAPQSAGGAGTGGKSVSPATPPAKKPSAVVRPSKAAPVDDGED